MGVTLKVRDPPPVLKATVVDDAATQKADHGRQVGTNRLHYFG